MPELVSQDVIRLLRPAITGYNAKGPIRDFLFASEPFVRPGEKNCSSKATSRHAVDMPGKQLGLLILRMSDGVHPKFAEDQRPFFGQILQPQKVTFELELAVQVNVETEKIHVLRQQILGRRIGCVGEQRRRIDGLANSDQLFDKFHDPAYA